MAGIWESQNKVIPAAYINVVTNSPLNMMPGDRGTVVIAQELSVGTDDEIYTITATDPGYPEKATAEDKKLANIALQGAKTVKIYKLKKTHTDEDVTNMLAKLQTVDFDVFVYPYTGSSTGSSKAKEAIVTWIKAMQDEEGANVTAVLANHTADTEYVINVVQGMKMADGTSFTADEVTAWVGGMTAGASITKSNTAAKFAGAIDVVPRMKKSEMETAIKAGKFIFTVDKAQNVSVVADINSLTTTTPEKGDDLKQNRTVRTVYGIREDINNLWESSVKGKFNNNDEGRSLLKGILVEYFNELQRREAIQKFDPDQLVIKAGKAINAVEISIAVQVVGSMEFAYVTVYLS